jgi:uncharacterized protein YktA (UPF0223 family)
MKTEGDDIRSVRHVSNLDTNSINKATEKASADRNFITDAVKQLEDFDFPAYKAQMIQFLKDKSADKDIISLFESLSGYRLYKDLYHVKKAFEQNNPIAKQDNQMTDETRKNLEVRQVDPLHKRKDYPEVPATAPKEYVCMLCGKSFQTRDDLIHHQEFEFKKN